MKKPIIFSMARSGSTLLQNYLYLYFSNKNGTLPGGEFFNPFSSYSLSDFIIPVNIQKSPPSETEKKIITKQRLKYFDKLTNKNYLIKITPFPLKYCPEIFEYFNDKKYHFIVLRRNNWIESALSYVKAHKTGIWHTESKLENNQTFYCSYKQLEERCLILQSFERRAKNINIKSEILYEDFESDHYKIFDLLNLKDWKTWVGDKKSSLLKTRNIYNFLDFENKEEIIKWSDELYARYLSEFKYYKIDKSYFNESRNKIYNNHII